MSENNTTRVALVEMEEYLYALMRELEEQLSMADMDTLISESMQNYKEGEVVRGRVVEIGEASRPGTYWLQERRRRPADGRIR